MPTDDLGNMMEAVFQEAEARFFNNRYGRNQGLRAQVETTAETARASGEVTTNLPAADRVSLYRLLAEEARGMMNRFTRVRVPRRVGIGTPESPVRTVDVTAQFAENPALFPEAGASLEAGARPYQVRPGVVVRGAGRGRSYRGIQRDYNLADRRGAPLGPRTYLRRSAPRGADRLAQGAEAAEVRVMEASRGRGGLVDQTLESALTELGAQEFSTMGPMRRPPWQRAPRPSGPELPASEGVTLPERIGGTGDMNAMAGEGSGRVAQYDAGVRNADGITRAELAANRARRFHGRAEGMRTLNRVPEADLAAGSEAGQQLAPVRSSFRDFIRDFLNASEGEGSMSASEAFEAFSNSRADLVNALVEFLQRQHGQ